MVLMAVAALIAATMAIAAPAVAKDGFPSWTPFERPTEEFPGEIPEGVAVDKTGNVFVSINSLGQVWKFTPDGTKSLLVDLPGAGAAGLAVDAMGNVYVAGGLMDAPYRGVWKVDRNGDATLVPGTDQIVLANALAFDHQGNLYISETFSFDDPTPYACAATGGGISPVVGYGDGGIWIVPRGGSAELWLRHPVLSGSCNFPIPYPVGANGIAYRHGSIYVNNTEAAQVLRIPVERDGSAGSPSVFAQVTDLEPVPPYPYLGPPGIDGIALDVHGNVYVPVINQSRIVRISADGTTQETIATWGDGLDFPTSLAFGTGKGERQNLFIVNSSIGPPFLAGPGLLKIGVGVPGMPLP
jgi:sugar lactone lactonase YvrE